MPGTTVLKRCDTDKPVSEFWKMTKARDGLQANCKPCNLTASSRSYRVRTYNVHPDWYDETLAAQDYRCAVCNRHQSELGEGKAGVFHIDHDHKCCPGEGSCGKCVRGLLCPNCNRGIGLLGDDVNRLMNAAAYLMTHEDVLESVAA